MNLKHLLIAATLFVVPATAALAQTNGYERHHINARQQDQQNRIAQGVRSGELRPGETARLEHQERRINREESHMRARDNGHLTRYDRHKLARQQNRESNRIYRDKHNNRTY